MTVLTVGQVAAIMNAAVIIGMASPKLSLQW
jgi:hypothetical protein